MTNEEAIVQLKEIRSDYEVDCKSSSFRKTLYQKDIEAIDLAIKALEEIERLEEENHRNFVNSQHIISVLIDENKKLRGEEGYEDAKKEFEKPIGKWQPLSLKALNGDDIVAYESSCCRAIADKKYQHCPNCGVKMDGSEK